MARAKYTNMALTVNGLPVQIVPNATITLYEAGTTTPLADTIYAGPTGGTTLTNPFVTDAYGNYTFYLDTPKSVKISATGLGIGTFVNDFEQLHPAPADIVGVLQNRTIKTSDGSLDMLRVNDGLAYARKVHVGDDTGATSDLIHGYYQNHTVAGAYTNTTGIVDAFAVEVTGQTSTDADLGAVLGVMRVRDSAGGIVSARALAGQLFVHDGALKADREALEIGVHNALAVTSKADNRSVYDDVFGTTGILITAFTGSIEPALGGGTAVDANTAITVATINTGGTAVGFKQFTVYWDKSGIKAHQVDGQGNVVAGGGGNNQASVAYGFLDTNGDIDAGTGMFWGGNDVVAFATNGTERLRIASQFIQGDFNNATVANRMTFQTIGANTNTFPQTAPSGAGTSSGLLISNASGMVNFGYGLFSVDGSAVVLDSNKAGTGTQLPLRLQYGGTTRIEANATGIGLYGQTPAARPSGYAVSNYTLNRGLDTSTATLQTVAWTLATLIHDLNLPGFISASG